MSSITIAHLRWSPPDGRTVFTDLNLQFQRERTGIVGRNGVGKSTLLRLIAQELSPPTGRVIIEGSTAMLRQMVQVPDMETIVDRSEERRVGEEGRATWPALL